MLRVILLFITLHLTTQSVASQSCWAPDLLDCPRAGNCWRAAKLTDADNPDRWLHTLEKIAAVLRQSPVFLENQDYRLQARYQAWYSNPATMEIGAKVVITWYPRYRWLDSCSLLPEQRDPLTGLNIDSGNYTWPTLTVEINDPERQLTRIGPASDRHLIRQISIANDTDVIFTEPRLVKTIGTASLYGNGRIYMTPHGLPLFVPITLAEYLPMKVSWLTNELIRLQKTLADTLIDTAKIISDFRQIYGDKIDRDDYVQSLIAAELNVRRDDVEANKLRFSHVRESIKSKQQERIDITNTLTSLSDSAAMSKVKIGTGKFGLATPAEADTVRFMFRLNPDLLARQKLGQRIYALTIYATGLEDQFGADCEQLLEKIDFTALQQLLDN